MKMKVRIEGGAALARTLNALPDKVSKSVRMQALRAGAEPLQQTMSQMAPRRPGPPDMADHIVVSAVRKGGVTSIISDEDTSAVAVGPEKKFFYGFFQEYGTVHHAAQPFARPAFDATVNQSIGIIMKALWAALIGKGFAVPPESEEP
jgi:HK97 gp10 family phage protein